MGRVSRGIEIRRCPPGARDREVARLTDPWIGEEGALDVSFRRGGGPALPRGVAFDETATVVWDEAGVEVLREVPPETPGTPGTEEDEMVALESRVLLRDRFAAQGPPVLYRVDFLRRGALQGSLWTPRGGNDA